MTEFKSVTGNQIFSQEYKEKLMEDYGKFYASIHERYVKDEYFDMMWLPDPKDIFKFDRKNNTHPIQFINQTHKLEIEKDKCELEHYRSLHKYDKAISDEQLNCMELHYRIRDLERQQVFNKSKELKREIEENKNLLKRYKENETTEKDRSVSTAASS